MAVAENQTITLSSKGQIVLPQAIRRKLRLAAGAKLRVEELDGKIVLEPEPLFKPTRLEDVYASANYKGAPVSIEEMDAAIMDEVKRRHARGRY